MSYVQTRHYSVSKEQGVPDGVLVEQALAGDQCAFAILVRRYHRLLVSYIQGFLKDREQVYDVLQHVFLKLYISLPILLTNVSLKGWLFQVARNRCLDELRRRYRRSEIPFSTLEWKYGEEELSPIETITDPDPLPEEVVERIELHCALQQAMCSLPPKFRSIVRLRCFRQQSFSEIGRMLNMPEPTVKTYFYRSLLSLRRELTSSVYFASISLYETCLFFTNQQTLPFTVWFYHARREQKVSQIERAETLDVFSSFTSHPFLPGGARV